MDHKINYKDLSFDDFKELAKNPKLSKNEKIGFPDSYRHNKHENIFIDIQKKISGLNKKNQTILDIGSGCGFLAEEIINHCIKNMNTLILIDSEEMLSHLPNIKCIKKFSGKFPYIENNFFRLYERKCNVLIVYSVIQYPFEEGNALDFLNKCLDLLAPNGEMLIGDIPNISMRNRFFKSENGKIYHVEYKDKNSSDHPPIEKEDGKINDNFILMLLDHFRSRGYHAWVLPQSSDLPMSNRREDVLIRKP